MDSETNPVETESELVEPSEPINENGCDDIEKPKVIEETVTHQSDDDKETDQSIKSVDCDQKPGDDSDILPLKSSTEEPIILCASETDAFDMIDSDASQNNSPEKHSNETALNAVASDEVETKHIEANDVQAADELPVIEEATPCNDQTQSVEVDDGDEASGAVEVDSSPEKSGSEMACLIVSPDPMNDSVNEKSESWEPIDDQNYDDSEEEVEDEDDVDSDVGGNNQRSNPKTAEQKTNNDCQVFELTDDNSSVDDARESEEEDDIDADEMDVDEEQEEEEEDDDENRSGKWLYC